MKAFLMHKDRDFDRKQALPPNEPALSQDLELNTLLNAMARGDDLALIRDWMEALGSSISYVGFFPPNTWKRLG
jgi:hypothetical protein